MKFTLIALLILSCSFVFGQTDDKKTEAPAPDAKSEGGQDKPSNGVAVSPSKLIFDAKAGMSQTKEVKIVNDSKKPQKFQINIVDFSMSRLGKPQNMDQGVFKYGLSNKINFSPSFVEVKPGQTQKIILTLNVPDNADANIAGWAMLTIDQVVERPPLDLKGNKDAVAMGIIPSFAFGIYLYHNPPNVVNNNIEIQKFTYKDTVIADIAVSKAVKNEHVRKLRMVAENVGDGIGFCVSYAELTNLKTGKTTKLNVKSFTILPGNFRDFFYELPKDIEKGTYNAVGVIDFGSDKEMKAAELEFKIE